MPDKYAVIGDKRVINSHSPFIHTEFAKQTQQDLVYQAIVVENDLLSFLHKLQTQGFRGVNITMPYKEQAFAVLPKQAITSDRARVAEAINTLVFRENGDWFADNTDGVGLVRDITHNQKWQIFNRNILICGAGGAVRGILQPLLLEKPNRIVIVNRTVAKAERLVKQFAKRGDIDCCSLAEIDKKMHYLFDLVINGIADEHNLSLPKTVLAAKCYYYDIGYPRKAEKTAFLQWVNAQDIAQSGHCADGLGMLVEQAAESYVLWRGIKPDTQHVLCLLKEAL